MANAPEEKVLRLWQGLGYYSRARNLHATAKHIETDLNGNFPSTYSEIIKLKGVGPYTAAAIASICFDEPQPVVDGNVFRFASRYFGIEADVSKSGTRKIFEDVLVNKISKTLPGTFNQAMMEFGATTCSPAPKCEECEFSQNCYAFQKGIQKSLPVKSGKTKVRDRYFNYVVLKNGDQYFLNERVEKDVWSGLYDFFLLEGTFDEEGVLAKVAENFRFEDFVLEDVSEQILHVLSHQKIHTRFYSIGISKKDSELVSQKTDLRSFSIEEMLNLPKPKLIVNYLNRIGIK